MAKSVRHKEQSYKALKPLGLVLDNLIDDFSNKEETPHLCIELFSEPGEYWFFHPGLFNLKWWWNEIMIYSDVIRDSIIKSKAFYVHEKSLERLIEEKNLFKKKDDVLKKYCEEIVCKKGAFIEDSVSRLFSLREKIAWIIYEIISSEFNFKIDQRNISFRNIRRKILELEKKYKNNDLLKNLKIIIADMNNEHINELFEFRHAFIHKFSPKYDTEQPPLVLASENEWDSLPLGTIRSRYLLHLISFTWKKLIKASNSLAKLNIGPTSFKLTVEDDPSLKTSSMVDILHTGLGTITDLGKIIVRCMKRCRGYKSEFEVNSDIDLNIKENMLKIVRHIQDIMLKIIPDFEPESKKGVFKFICDKSSKMIITFLTLTYSESNKTFVQEGIQLVDKDLDNPNLEKEWFTVDELSKIEVEELKDWPKDVVETLINTLKKKYEGPKSIRMDYTNKNQIKYHLIFPSLKEKLSRLEAKSQLWVIDWIEDIETGEN
ncbi:MAG: hypothetical protein L6246_08505 [Thermodesulfovibrionales bacterium]|nr:hypothetical protein [Thermodesulfovibrionales bacterium]